MPLVIYSGQIDVSGSPFHSAVVTRLPDWSVPDNENETANWHRAIVGFANLVGLFRDTKTPTYPVYGGEQSILGAVLFESGVGG